MNTYADRLKAARAATAYAAKAATAYASLCAALYDKAVIDGDVESASVARLRSEQAEIEAEYACSLVMVLYPVKGDGK